MSGIAPKATILVPAYNTEATLERCLRSAFAQTLREVEIIVANDGSTDATGEIASRLAREDPRLIVIHLSPNGGKPAAMNRLIERATGAWIAVLDADDVYAPTRLETLIAAAEAAGVDMAADNLAYRDAGIDRVVRTGFDPTSAARIIGIGELVDSASTVADFDFGVLKPVIRRSFQERHGLRYFEDTRLAEDFYYLLAYMAEGGRCVLLPEPTYEWTMPFGMVSRQWTRTGAGAWRYDYHQALRANDHFLRVMRGRGEAAIVAMLERRGREYRVMTHYLKAQRQAADRHWGRSLMTLASYPPTLRLLLARVVGRIRRTRLHQAQLTRS